MPNRRLEVKNHLTNEELKTRYRSCRDSKEARRWHVLWLVSQGYSAQEVAEIVGLESTWVRRIIHRYNKDGPGSIIDGHSNKTKRHKFSLNAEQQHLLSNVLKEDPPDGGIWTGSKVATWIEQLTGVKIYPQMGWSYLRKIGPALKAQERKPVSSATIKEKKQFSKIEVDDKVQT
jgi:transposase